MNSQTEIGTAAVAEHVLTVAVGENGNADFEFAFRMDGTGSCRDIDYCGEPIRFTWEPSEIDSLQGEERSDTLRDLAQELFWDEINAELGEDRVLQEVDFGSDEVSFETGSEEELERLVRIVLYSFPSIWDEERTSIDLTICAATECDEAAIDDYCDLMEDGKVPDEIKSAIRELIDYGLGWNSPVGSHLEYNDGAPDRASGYSETSNSLWFSVPRPSFHELAEAREQLLAAFADHEARAEAEQLLRAGE